MGKVGARALEALVLIAVVALVWSNYALRKRLKSPAFQQSAEVRAFAVGQRLERVPVLQTGRANHVLDLTQRRTLVAVVNPSCGSCRSIVEAVASVKPVEPVFFTARETAAELARTAAPLGLNDRIFALDPSLTRAFQDRFVVNPQIFVVDRGKVVRTCDTVQECM